MDLKAINYDIGGKTFTGYLADGSAGAPAPGILVAHEGAGLTDHPKERAKMLAELGYVAFALDWFGEKEPTLDKAKDIVRNLRANPAEMRRRAGAAHDLLREHPSVDPARTAAIGFCFGGAIVLELARSGADLLGVVGFHAELTTRRPQDASAIRAKILACLGAEDPIVNGQQRTAFTKEMSDAGVDWQMILYGGAGHSFTNRDIDAWGFPGFAYNAAADRRSWQVMRAFLQEALGPAAA